MYRTVLYCTVGRRRSGISIGSFWLASTTEGVLSRRSLCSGKMPSHALDATGCQYSFAVTFTDGASQVVQSPVEPLTLDVLAHTSTASHQQQLPLLHVTVTLSNFGSGPLLLTLNWGLNGLDEIIDGEKVISAVERLGMGCRGSRNLKLCSPKTRSRYGAKSGNPSIWRSRSVYSVQDTVQHSMYTHSGPRACLLHT